MQGYWTGSSGSEKLVTHFVDNLSQVLKFVCVCVFSCVRGRKACTGRVVSGGGLNWAVLCDNHGKACRLQCRTALLLCAPREKDFTASVWDLEKQWARNGNRPVFAWHRLWVSERRIGVQ